jgi:hypothetical protein
MTQFVTDWIWKLLLSFRLLNYIKKSFSLMLSSFSHLEMGMAKSRPPGCIVVGGRCNKECEGLSKSKIFNKKGLSWQLYAKKQAYLRRAFEGLIRVCKIDPWVNLHPSHLRKNSFLRTFTSQKSHQHFCSLSEFLHCCQNVEPCVRTLWLQESEIQYE